MRPGGIHWLPVIATGSLRRRWHCEIGSSIAGCRARATIPQSSVSAYDLSLEFLPGRLLMDLLKQCRPGRANAACACRTGGGASTVCVPWSRTRRSATVAWAPRGLLHGQHGQPPHPRPRLRHSLQSWAVPAGDAGWLADEYPENWLSFGNPWEFERPTSTTRSASAVCGHRPASDGTSASVWHPDETVIAIAYDTPVVGWRGKHANTLRLWSARAPDPLALETFNRGDHVGALAARARANSISQILYPSDETPAGQELRLRQEYFFSSASLQDLLHRHIRQYGELHNLADKCAIQLNDTHPAIVVAELMRLLVDEHRLPWDEAWRITRETISYTNHTLLPEALETWPVPLMERLLPRHMQIIYEINKLHLDSLAGRAGCA